MKDCIKRRGRRGTNPTKRIAGVAGNCCREPSIGAAAPILLHIGIRRRQLTQTEPDAAQ